MSAWNVLTETTNEEYTVVDHGVICLVREPAHPSELEWWAMGGSRVTSTTIDR